MIRIHSEQDLYRLQHLQNKNKLLVRFMMNGCTHCENSQQDWDNAVNVSSDETIAEIEASFLNNFKQAMQHRKTNIFVQEFPTILVINGNKVKEHPGRDTASIKKLLHKKKRSTRRKRRTCKRRFCRRTCRT